MAGFPNPMNLFRSAAVGGSAKMPGDTQNTPANTGNNTNEEKPVGAAGTGAPNPQLDQASQTSQNKPGGAASPLDAFKDLWSNNASDGDQNANKDKSGSQPGTNTVATPEHPYSQKKLVDAAKRMDFSRSIPPEILQKAFPGGDPKAIGDILNNIGRQAFAAGGHLSVQISQGEVTGFQTKFDTELPAKLRQHSVNSSDYSNPAFKHPALKPLVDATRTQISERYPDAPIAEIDRMTQEYLGAVMQEITGQDPAKKQQTQQAAKDQQGQQSRGEFDWSKEFDQA